MVTRPRQMWAAIEAEPTSVPDLYPSYVAPLAAVPAVCGFAGLMFFGIGVFDVGMRPPLGVALLEAVASYVLTLVGVYVVALVIDWLAPRFGGAGSRMQAFKLAAYAASPLWLSGVFLIYPPIGELAGMLAGLYSLEVLHLGLPRLMVIPPERRLAYFAAVLVAILLVAVLFGSVTTRIRDLGGPLRMAAAQASPM